MEILVIYAVLAILVGFYGSTTTLGFGSAFLLSVVLSPVIGFIICILYPSKAAADARLKQQIQQTQLLQNIAKPAVSLADEIARLKKQLDDGIITPAEFESLKAKLINS